MSRVIFHVDVNSAFLSWSAAYRVRVLGEREDLRDIPSAVAGERAERHGIILAKSIPAKKCGVKTGEQIFLAQQKCPGLKLVPPDYALYVEASRRFIALLREFAPVVEQYSIDEAWADLSGTEGLYGSPVAAAELLRARIREELGFTVNIGISSNKLLAKMAGEFEKPDKVHTLFPEEVPQKLWPLPVRELFMLGPATERRLNRIGIHTIGELAQADPELLLHYLNKPGLALWHSANGRCSEELLAQPEANKGYGNSTTLPADVTTEAGAQRVLLSLCETVAMRLRRDGKAARCISVSLRSADFVTFSHQTMLREAVHGTEELFRCAIDEAWADLSGTEGLYGSPVAAAELLRARIREELGFTVNIGISSNKLLAKMAGEFEKPDKVHTLFPEEVPQKLWPLPVRELFMLGPATERRLNRIGIHTIGELAQADPELLLHYLNKPGLALWHSANGRCSEELLAQPEANKGYGNSTTLPADVTTEAGAQRVLLSLCETVAMRLRRDGKAARCISVSLRSADFVTFSHQTMLREAVHGTEELFRCACRVFAEAWDGQTPLRQLGVQATRLEEPQPRQLDLFAVGGAQQYARKAILDGTVDALREKYGEGVIRRARFTGADTVLAGGLSRERRTGITKPLDAE